MAHGHLAHPRQRSDRIQVAERDSVTCRELTLERFNEGNGAYESSKRAPLTCAQGQRKRSHDTNSPKIGSIVPGEAETSS